MKEVFDIDYPKTLKLEDMEEFAYHIKDALILYEVVKMYEAFYPVLLIF